MHPWSLRAGLLVFLALPAVAALPAPALGTGPVCDAIDAPGQPSPVDDACGTAACQFLVPAAGIPLPVWPSEYGISVGDSSGSVGLLDCHSDLDWLLTTVKETARLEPICPYLPQACDP